MIPLAAPLDDVDFDGLVALARDRLPALAPEWTDYNYSDPGITLVELLAWIADTQIYSLGRDRLDERLAMAALLGIRSEGAVPASGTLYPSEPSVRQTVAAASRLTPVRAHAPRLEAAHEVTLQPVTLERVLAEGPDGVRDLTATNAQARAAFSPFDGPGGAGRALRLVFDGAMDPDSAPFSIGFQLEGGEAATSDELGGMLISYAIGGRERPIAGARDFSRGLQRCGAMLLPVPAGVAGRTRHEFLLRPAAGAALAPRLLHIAGTALPVVQRATLRAEPGRGTGRVGQKLAVEPDGLFAADEAASGHVWRLVQEEKGLGFDLSVDHVAGPAPWRPGDLGDAGPNDLVFGLAEREDGSRIEAAFGNGVNGRRPPSGAAIEIGLRLSAGASGNVAGGLAWTLVGAGTSWTNPQPVTGGRDPADLPALSRRLIERLGDRTLATARQIEQAATALAPGFAIVRAAVIDGWEPGRRRTAWPATRTLLVMPRGGGEAGRSWRRAIARSLRPRLPLGERLVVAAPRPKPLRLRIRVRAAPGRTPDTIAGTVRDSLSRRLAIEAWPLGRPVTGTAVAGWIRLVEGVADVTVTLTGSDGRPLPGNALMLARDELPQVGADGLDLDVEGAPR